MSCQGGSVVLAGNDGRIARKHSEHRSAAWRQQLFEGVGLPSMSRNKPIRRALPARTDISGIVLFRDWGSGLLERLRLNLR